MKSEGNRAGLQRTARVSKAAGDVARSASPCLSAICVLSNWHECKQWRNLCLHLRHPRSGIFPARVLVNVPAGKVGGSPLVYFVDRPESLFDRW
jgi:hypothetical protein